MVARGSAVLGFLLCGLFAVASTARGQADASSTSSTGPTGAEIRV